MAFAPLSQTLVLTEDGSSLALVSPVTIPPPPVLPPPAVQSPAGIEHDGSPQVGETLTGIDPVFTNATIDGRRWEREGETIAISRTVVPAMPGNMQWIVTGVGNDGTPIESRATVLVADITPVPVPDLTNTFGNSTLKPAQVVGAVARLTTIGARLEAVEQGAVSPPTLTNTLGTSNLKPAQVDGATPRLTSADNRITILGA